MISDTRARDQTIAALFDKRKGRYGSPRLARDLRQAGTACNDKTVARSMRRQGLVAKAGRKFKATTNSRHSLAVAPNLLEQKFLVQVLMPEYLGDNVLQLREYPGTQIVFADPAYPCIEHALEKPPCRVGCVVEEIWTLYSNL